MLADISLVHMCNAVSRAFYKWANTPTNLPKVANKYKCRLISTCYPYLQMFTIVPSSPENVSHDNVTWTLYKRKIDVKNKQIYTGKSDTHSILCSVQLQS